MGRCVHGGDLVHLLGILFLQFAASRFGSAFSFQPVTYINQRLLEFARRVFCAVSALALEIHDLVPLLHVALHLPCECFELVILKSPFFNFLKQFLSLLVDGFNSLLRI